MIVKPDKKIIKVSKGESQCKGTEQILISLITENLPGGAGGERETKKQHLEKFSQSLVLKKKVFGI